jgi:hypothetical protein
MTANDPYEVAPRLIAMAKDVMADITSITINELANTLVEAADTIMNFADAYNSIRPQITVNVNGSEVIIPEDIVSRIIDQLVRDWVVSVLTKDIELGY